MGRPRKRNPKNKHIGIVTTEDKFKRFKALGLKGDKAIDVLLYHLETENMRLKIEKSEIIRRLKQIEKEIEDLDYEKLALETKLEEINSEIGVSKETGLNKNVDRCVQNVLLKYNEQSFGINDFIEMNKKFVIDQAYLADVPFDEFKRILYESV